MDSPPLGDSLCCCLKRKYRQKERKKEKKVLVKLIFIQGSVIDIIQCSAEV